MEKSIKVAVIGAGGRAKGVVNNLMRDSNRRAEVVAVYDPDPAMMDEALKLWQWPDAVRAQSAEAAVQTPGVEWVMVFSPNAFHKEHILLGFKAGKHVFSEKPLATAIEDCQEIYASQQRSGLLFATGFVLRYAPIYRKAKELLDSGKFGKILSIEGNENIAPAHGGYIMTNWRRHVAMSGPHILEKCCHDLDLIEWYADSLPSKVAATASRKFFVPANAGLLDKYSAKTFLAWPDPHRIASPFSGDTDLDDELMSFAEFRNGIRVSFTATMANAMPERRLRFNCELGTLVVELYAMSLRYVLLEDLQEEHVVHFGGDGHAGGDDVIMKELFDTMVNHTVPKCSGNEGLASAVYALALDRAAKSGTVIDLEPIWAKLGR